MLDFLRSLVEGADRPVPISLWLTNEQKSHAVSLVAFDEIGIVIQSDESRRVVAYPWAVVFGVSERN